MTNPSHPVMSETLREKPKPEVPWEQIAARDVAAMPLSDWLREEARRCRVLEAAFAPDTQGRTYWSACAAKYEAADQIIALLPLEELAHALGPLKTLADTFTDEDGWSSPMRRERIIDWIGPSECRFARTAHSKIAALMGGDDA